MSNPEICFAKKLPRQQMFLKFHEETSATEYRLVKDSFFEW